MAKTSSTDKEKLPLLGSDDKGSPTVSYSNPPSTRGLTPAQLNTKEEQQKAEDEQHENEYERWAKLEDEEDDKKKKANQKRFLRESRKIKRRINTYLNEYRKLSTYFERTMIQHKLARDHFATRSFYWNFVPLTLLSSLTAILGFLITGGSYSSDHLSQQSEGTGETVSKSLEVGAFVEGDIAEYIALAIGIIGAVSTIVTTFGKYYDYESRAAMHLGAVKALEKVRLNICLEIQWFERAAMSNADIIANVMSGEADKTLTKFDDLGADLAAHHAKIQAMQDACADSPVPDEIIRAFNSMKQFTSDDFGYQDTSRLDAKHDIALIIYLYNKLWKEFMDSWMWPMYVPNIAVLKKAEKWQEEFAKNHLDAESQSMSFRNIG